MTQMTYDLMAWALIVLGAGIGLAAIVYVLTHSPKTLFPDGIGTRGMGFLIVLLSMVALIFYSIEKFGANEVTIGLITAFVSAFSAYVTNYLRDRQENKRLKIQNGDGAPPPEVTP